MFFGGFFLGFFLVFFVVNDSKMILLLSQISSKSCEFSLELLEGAGALSGWVEGMSY